MDSPVFSPCSLSFAEITGLVGKERNLALSCSNGRARTLRDAGLISCSAGSSSQARISCVMARVHRIHMIQYCASRCIAEHTADRLDSARACTHTSTYIHTCTPHPGQETAHEKQVSAYNFVRRLRYHRFVLLLPLNHEESQGFLLLRRCRLCSYAKHQYHRASQVFCGSAPSIDWTLIYRRISSGWQRPRILSSCSFAARSSFADAPSPPIPSAWSVTCLTQC